MLTPMDLFNWAKTAIPNIEFIFVSAAKIEEWSKSLERRFKRAIAITGTRSFHSFTTTTRPGELIASTLPDPRSKLPSKLQATGGRCLERKKICQLDQQRI
jgi:hypothetical protein